MRAVNLIHQKVDRRERSIDREAQNILLYVGGGGAPLFVLKKKLAISNFPIYHNDNRLSVTQSN